MTIVEYQCPLLAKARLLFVHVNMSLYTAEYQNKKMSENAPKWPFVWTYWKKIRKEQ